MKQSLRAKRMARRHRRLAHSSKLNLVSLMDVFTILVFFLLLNYGDAEVLQVDKSIKLPQSLSEQIPDNNLVIALSGRDLLVGGRSVGSIAELSADTAEHFAPLVQELQYQASRASPLSEAQQLAGRPVTILADQSLPYHLLKKVMATSAAAEYRDISLAVTQHDKQGGQ